MNRLVDFFHKLFARPFSLDDDPLMGAIDLSDADYCLGLLKQPDAP